MTSDRTNLEHRRGVAPTVLVRVRHVTGDLLIQPAEALVNPWNRNYMPRWLLVPHGVSGALKKRTGPGPWRDLARRGLLRHGVAVVTDAGDLAGPDYLIHVAGLNLWWRATRNGVRECTRNAVLAAAELGVASIAMPLIGAGTGGLSERDSLELIESALAEFTPAGPHGPDVPEAIDVAIVSYRTR